MQHLLGPLYTCLLYTSDAADDSLRNNNIVYDIMSNDMILVPEFEVEVGLVTTTEEKSTRLFEDISIAATNWFKGFIGLK